MFDYSLSVSAGTASWITRMISRWLFLLKSCLCSVPPSQAVPVTRWPQFAIERHVALLIRVSFRMLHLHETIRFLSGYTPMHNRLQSLGKGRYYTVVHGRDRPVTVWIPKGAKITLKVLLDTIYFIAFWILKSRCNLKSPTHGNVSWRQSPRTADFVTLDIATYRGIRLLVFFFFLRQWLPHCT